MLFLTVAVGLAALASIVRRPGSARVSSCILGRTVGDARPLAPVFLLANGMVR
jgi:hypothetical protein